MRMLRKLLTGVAVLCAAMPFCFGQGGAFPAKGRGTLRLMTYNVGAFGKSMEDSSPMVAAMVREAGADAVALNELDSCNARHGVFQAARLADLLGGWHYAFRSAMPYAGGGYGSGLVCRDRIRRTFAIPIPRGDGSEPRVCVVAETRRYVIASTHLDHISEASRVEGARRIAEALTARYGRSRKPVFLLGDMNDRPGSAPLRELEKHFTALSGTDPTYPSDEPHICIDYVLVLNNRAKVHRTDGAVCARFADGDVTIASDHRPVFVDVAR